MIKFLSNWIEGIVIAVIIASIFEMLLPNRSLKKYIKVILGIYVIFSIISPFVNSKELYSFDINDKFENLNIESTLSDSINSNNNNKNNENNFGNIEKMYTNAFEKEIIKKVEEEGYDVSSCNVNAVFDNESEDFGIKKINIVLKNKSKNKNENTNRNKNKTTNDEKIKKIEEIDKINIEIGSKTDEDSKLKSITDKDILVLQKNLSDYFEIDKDIIFIQK